MHAGPGVATMRDGRQLEYLVEGDPDVAAALERIRRHCAATGQPLHTISAATGRGIPELLRAVAARLVDLGWARAAS